MADIALTDPVAQFLAANERKDIDSASLFDARPSAVARAWVDPIDSARFLNPYSTCSGANAFVLFGAHYRANASGLSVDVTTPAGINDPNMLFTYTF